MKKYLIGGLILATMFTGISCGSKANEGQNGNSKNLEEAKIAVNSEEYDKARNLFKLASDEEVGENKEIATNSYELLSSYILAQKALEDKDIEEAKIQLGKIENDTTYPNLIEDIKELKKKIEAEDIKNKDLDEKLETINNFLKDNNLEAAQKTFGQINLEALSKEGNKKYADMSVEIRKLEEKVEAEKKKDEDKKKKDEKEAKKDKNQLLDGSKEIYIDYDDAGSEDEFESYKFAILADGSLKVDTATHKTYPTGTLRLVEENKWSGSLYDSAHFTDEFCDVVVTNDAIKIINEGDQGKVTTTLYIKSQTYKSEFIPSDGREATEQTGSFTLK